MNHDEKRVWLIKYLLDEADYANEIPQGVREQRRLLRGLMNMRAPRSAAWWT